MSELTHLTIHELQELLHQRQVSSVEATTACLEQAAATADLGAFLALDEEGALQAARAADQRLAAGTALGPLDGVPLAIKDILLTKDLPTTCASQILANFKAPYEATAVRKLKDAGAVILGKANMDEFAMGSSTEHSAFKLAKNPWDPERVPGGSSGGSAVAVAAGSAFGALGTDTGGSIRQPCSLTGLVGLKPTYGRVSRYGVIAYASSLDQVGPMTKDVQDCALLLEAISGVDPQDATSAPKPVPAFAQNLRQQLETARESQKSKLPNLKIGIPQEYVNTPGLDPEVAASLKAALKTLQDLGAKIVDISLPHTDYCIATYYVLATAEASSNLARYDGVRYGLRVDPHKGLLDMYLATRGAGFGAEVKRRIMLGTYVLSAGYYDAYYLQAQKVRTLICQDFQQAFKKVDLLVTPTTPTPAFKLGENLNDPLAMYLADIYTVSVNLAGLPALSLPCGFSQQTPKPLPLGLQLIGPWWHEEHILTVAAHYERAHDYHRARALGA